MQDFCSIYFAFLLFYFQSVAVTQEASQCAMCMQFDCVLKARFRLWSLYKIRLLLKFCKSLPPSLWKCVCRCVCARVSCMCAPVCGWYQLSSRTRGRPWMFVLLVLSCSMWNMSSNNTVWSCNSHNQSVIHISFYINWKSSHDFLPFSVTLGHLAVCLCVPFLLLLSVDLIPVKRSVTFSVCFLPPPPPCCTLGEIESV